ncbi:MAG TPA: hypothetical protein VF691_04085 [Cytophagaceae bacterium]
MILKAKLILLLITLATGLSAQKKNQVVYVPMSSDKWEYNPAKVRFITHKGQKAVRIDTLKGEDRQQLTAKNILFTNGTIEFDVEITVPPFLGISFREQGNEKEHVYLRVGRAGKATAGDAVQYTPIIKGVNLWNVYPNYQSAADIRSYEWNHVKLVVSGMQMRVFVNGKLALSVHKLEGNSLTGGVSIEGPGIYANMVIRHNEVENLDPNAGVDPTAYDLRYIRKWKVSPPVALPYKQELNNLDVPKTEEGWTVIKAEYRGLVNLVRVHGPGKERRAAWLKVNIKSEKDQVRKIDIGFSSEVWVFMNGQMVYIDKNYYSSPIRKQPDGRCSIENGSFYLPLRKGENELVVGLADDLSGYGGSAFGWGAILRFDRVEELEF